MFHQPIIIAIEFDHLVRPALDYGIVPPEPRSVPARSHVVRSSLHKRRVGIQQIEFRIQILVRFFHAARLDATNVPVERLAKNIERTQAFAKGWQLNGRHRIFEEGECACVAGNIIGKDAPSRIQLKHTQEVSSVRVISRVILDARFARVRTDGCDIEPVLDWRILCGGKRHSYESIFGVHRVVAEAYTLSRSGDAKGPVMGNVQYSRKVNCPNGAEETK